MFLKDAVMKLIFSCSISTTCGFDINFVSCTEQKTNKTTMQKLTNNKKQNITKLVTITSKTH